MKRLLTFCCALLTAASAGAQKHAGKADWKVSAAPAGAGLYTISFEARMSPGWLIGTLDAGGAARLIPTSVKIDPGTATVTAPLSEQGFATELNIAPVGRPARYYNYEALFTVQVKGRRGSTVKGSYSYQLCSDKECLPPDTVPFSVTLP